MTPEIRGRLGAKRAEVSLLIYHEIRKRGYTGASFGALIGCSAPNISRTINGNSHSALVLDALRAIGVPEKYLFDPRRFGAAPITVKTRNGTAA